MTFTRAAYTGVWGAGLVDVGLHTKSKVEPTRCPITGTEACGKVRVTTSALEEERTRESPELAVCTFRVEAQALLYIVTFPDEPLVCVGLGLHLMSFAM